jgi:hypothetical protein
MVEKFLQVVDCTVHSSTQVKLAEMEKLHEAFSVHALCEALKVPRAHIGIIFYVTKNQINHSLYVERCLSLRLIKFSKRAIRFMVQSVNT